MKQVDYRVATLFVQERHYSPVMPKLTKQFTDGRFAANIFVGYNMLNAHITPGRDNAMG